MPELPEVETTLRGIQPYIKDKTIQNIVVRQHQLRWPIPEDINVQLTNQRIINIKRRAKYLLLQCTTGTLIIHLGMSGRLSILEPQNKPGKHDHVDIFFDDGYLLRYTDPRRFGAILWTTKDTSSHPLLNHLGPEPLSSAFNGEYLYRRSQGKKTNIKSFIMNGEIVVGIGNIYANEALFLAKIHPKASVNELSQKQFNKLAASISKVLDQAITAGGTTLKDFRKSNGKPGYFTQQLNVYGRKGEQCKNCGCTIETFKQTQRATYCCPLCQKIT